MHTIPQNVTAYEDRIVGMLVGRQFIYLAIGGVIIFILLSTNVGPIFIRAFLSLLVGGLAAALALFKPNDRNFDALLMSYVRAIFGPTEWVWRKDTVSIDKLRLITDQMSGKTSIDTQDPSLKASRNSQDNLLRVSRFQTFISERESGMDNEELEFIEQLNFSEPVPQKTFEMRSSSEAAPPMLTKQNYHHRKAPSAPPVNPSPPAQLPNQPKPLAAIAGNSNQLGTVITIDGRTQGIRLRNNMRTNRSLSHQLLSTGIMALPVRGERQFDLSEDLKSELQNISRYMQPTTPQSKKPSTLLTGEPLPKKSPAIQSHPIPAPAPVAPASVPATVTAKKAERIHRMSDYDNNSASTVSQQISMLSQALPNSGITKEGNMSDSTKTNTPTPHNDQTQPAQPHQDATVTNSASSSSVASDAILEQEANRIEAEAEQGMAKLPQPVAQSDSNPAPPQMPASPPPSNPDANRYQSEINRLKAHSQEMEQKAQQAEEALRQLQQQLANQPQDAHPAIGAQQELVDKLRQQQAQSNNYRQELEQKLSEQSNQPHLHAEYAPLPEVSPVISEQPSEPTPPAPAVAPQPTPSLQSASPTSPSSAVPAPDSGELDLQAKMAAAGVGSAEPAAVETPPAAANAATVATQKTVTLTSQPNIINGTVVDAQGQLIPGVIVVVKNAQGESKRALKTNKLGQFVVTTPLANGSYSVEVDKKGLSFDIMNVELAGTVLPPLIIKSKSS